MAITIDWGTKVINIPQTDLTLISGSLYELNTDTKLRADVNALQASEEGIVFDTTHTHNTEITIAGVTYARTLEFINGYTITLEDLQYRTNLIGSNNNVTDVLNLNQVSVIPSNSAGLIKTEGGVTRPRRAKSLKNFTFVMFDSKTREAKTGLTVAGQIRKDAGTFVAVVNAPVEVSNGIYEISEFTVTEMTADVVTLLFTATGAVVQVITIVTAGE